MDEVGRWLKDNQSLLIILVVALFLLVLLQRTITIVLRILRRRRPADLNPKLHKYGGPGDAQLRAEQEKARTIIATSSTGTVAGYRIVRQIEAVFVEGRRSQKEAITALKAASADLGANAIINLGYESSVARRCTARGDAVVVQPQSGQRAPV